MSQTIALLTDFGLQDNYAGIMKGVILKINPRVQLVDITHQIGPQNILQGALALKTAYSYFPEKTIFVCVVDPGVGSRRRALIVQTQRYTFLAPDNGLLDPTLKIEKPKAICTITNDRYFLKPVSQTFHGRDVFAPAAAYLSKGISPKNMGSVIQKILSLDLPAPRLDRSHQTITGTILDIDHFGNLITNIEKHHLSLFKKSFRIKIKRKVIRRTVSAYSESKAGEVFAIFGSKGYLEIFVNRGSAAGVLKVRRGEPILLSE